MQFLKTVAHQINTRFSNQLHRIAVVFPNHRQAVFFKSYLQEILLPPAFLPELLTIEELVQRSSIHPVADHFVQSFALYDAYAEVMTESRNEQPLDYEKFFSIGDILLRDFQELDAYLCYVPKVYEQLKDIEGIEKSFDILSDEQKQFLKNFWSSFSSERKSVQQQKFLELWQMLPAIYQLFHQKLADQQLTTLGMAYRQLAAEKQSRQSFADGWQHIAFVGFNAFNKAEETLLQRWQQQGKASLWMDIDEHYVANQLHEAGHFIRRNIYKLQLKNELPLLKEIAAKTSTIEVIAAQGATAQTKFLPQWLSGLASDKSGKSIAIILGDEGLLLPVLQSLPTELGNVNVTMGYPLKQSVLFSFIQTFFLVQTDLAIHHDRDVNHEQVLAFLQHPLCDWTDIVKQDLQMRMVKEVMLRIPLNQLQGHSDIGNYVFSPLHKPGDIFSRLLSMLEAFHRNKNLDADSLLQGLLVQVWQAVQQLKELFLQRGGLTLPFLTQSLRKQLATITVPFEGEPLQGIQVMGLLESRGLDFDHIIVLSANEGILPRIQSPNSFLPYSIRCAFGLSVPEHQDAIFAYAFYRLLHRCQSMTMLYNATINEQSTGEVSRFVPQLEFETRFSIRKNDIRFALKSQVATPIVIEKTAEVMKLFNAYFISDKPKTISPSAVNAYLNCQLQFYFRYLANLKEPDEMQDEVDAAVFGSIVHNLMELLYKAVLEKNGHWHISKEDIEWMKTQVPVWIQQAFKDGWREKSKQKIVFTGRLLIVAEVVTQYVNAYLDYDATNVPFTIEALETKFNEAFYITIKGARRPVYFSGYIDRIDIVGGIHRMVDYKTGGDEMEFTTIEKLFDRNEKKRNKAALQTLIYAWSFSKKFPDKSRFEPALLPLRIMQKEGNSFSPQFVSKISRTDKLTINADSIHPVLNQMEDHLRTVLEELFNPEIPFAQTDDIDRCNYCPYIAICGRE